MVLGDEPGPVREDLVDLVQVAQLGRDILQSLQPARIAALLPELAHLLPDQVRTLVPAGRLFINLKKKNFLLMNKLYRTVS